jgi:uncharacterized protein (TIGR02145 family)
MKKITLFILFLCAALLSAKSQSIELTFGAVDGEEWTKLNGIKIKNLTQDTDTTIYWPDTTLVLYYVGLNDSYENHSAFRLYQNYPNPVVNKSNVKIDIPGSEKTLIRITDMLGRQAFTTEKILNKGTHEFTFRPGNAKVYFLTVYWNGISQSIKMINAAAGNGSQCELIYGSHSDDNNHLKHTAEEQVFSYALGDSLLYVGLSGDLESGLLDAPEESTSYTFQFATNIACPGLPTVEYEGVVYNTIQVYSQCWMKENLDAGNMIWGTQNMTDNGILEKYCYNNEPDSCAKYGGLYQWNEMMQFSVEPGAQGICPPGWHIPTDEEWKILEGAADSQFGIGDPEWDIYGYRGYDAGSSLKTVTGWEEEGNGTDQYGFSGLPGGFRNIDGSFGFIRNDGSWWTSSIHNEYSEWSRRQGYDRNETSRNSNGKAYGLAVRCLKDN